MANHDTVLKPIDVSFVGTYPPRQCGIGTFTHDLGQSIAQLQGETVGTGETVRVVALSNKGGIYNYGPEVQFEIQAQHRMDYRGAADFLNLSAADVISLQHEFGIFGGDDGAYVIDLLSRLTRPVVSTLHTVLQEPTPGQLETLKAVCARSTLVVVMAQRAIELLVDIYGVPREKIILIHHGAPDIPFLDPVYTKDQFQAEGRRVILSFGLLNPNKGIEVAIEAISKVVKEFPDLLYIVLGATHPEVKRLFGEEYRLSLERLVKSKGLEEHVVFYDRFVSLEQLTRFLVAADIYITPYLAKEQITSGTLAYAMACGKAIISTPYWYAEELLAEDRGLLVPFHDPEALAVQLRRLLGDEAERDVIRKRAYQFGRQMVWREVASDYVEAFRRALHERRGPIIGLRTKERTTKHPSLPEIRLEHLRLLTDDTGILQHAAFTTPDRRHGYATDDNARALILTIMNWKLFRDEEILPLLQRYLSFLNYALNEESGRMRNFMNYDRHFVEEMGSEDSHARTLWALGTSVAYASTDSIIGLAARTFQQILPVCEDFTSPRAWAYSILGSLAYLKRFGGDREAQHIHTVLAKRLLKSFVDNGSPDWPWGEDIITYDNARLPQALIAAGAYLGKDDMRDHGLRSLKWLLEIQTDPQGGHLSLIGNNGWFKRKGKRARFDQQPMDATALIDACYEAFLVTEDEGWLASIEQCFDWFLGRNDVHATLVELTTGGCRDGLHAAGVNQNQGAESTISWLMALHSVHQIVQERPSKT
jgi:glycosyltransferase involved in cell wall biosynthesis